MSDARQNNPPAAGSSHADRDEQAEAILLAQTAIAAATQGDVDDKQFTLRDMFLLVTIAAVLSWPLSHLPRPAFAGLAGGLTVLLMFVQAFFEPRHALMRYGWWALLIVYLVACAMAVSGL